MVTIDLKMQDMNGFDVMRETMTERLNIGYKIKNNSEYKSIPIIFMSSIGKQTGFSVDTEFINGNEFLEKPINLHNLSERIKNTL
ncbi:hypothetical protein ACFL2X_02035 [Candidatus Latescibacterota bacterium]